MTTIEDQAVYDAQAIAFEGTPLGDRLSYRTILREVEEIVTDPWIVPFVGDVRVELATVRLTSDAYAKGQLIRVAPNDMPRYTAVHEVAHVVARRCATRQATAHGPQFRTLFGELVSVVYGERYGRLLWQAFGSMDLHVDPALLPRPERPIIDIDVLADASRGSRWL